MRLTYTLERVRAANISLFGSRGEPKRCGGDIDLLLLTTAPAFETAQNIAIRFFLDVGEKLMWWSCTRII